jgi:hypothetical protein
MFERHTLELSDRELRMLHHALHANINDFGHDQADVLREAKRLHAKLPEPGLSSRVPGGDVAAGTAVAPQIIAE